MRRRVALALPIFLALAACGNGGPRDSDDYGNLLASPAGFIVVQEEHPRGWGRPDCFTCHVSSNMHQVNRTGIPELDLAEVRQVVRNQGEASCVQCHGDNGVGP
jgi:hypothetical protein